MKKYFFAFSSIMLGAALLLGGCSRGTGEGVTEPKVTTFEEKQSYYDELAKGEIEVEAETTAGDKSYEFIGDKSILPAVVLERLEYVVDNCYLRMYSKYGESFSRPKITINIDVGYARNDASYAVDKMIYLNPDWMLENPEDADSLICAIMGTMQTYDNDAPQWIKTGIQNYVRSEFSTVYTDKEWALPGAYDGHSYEEGGVYAAAFLRWINLQIEDVDVVYRLNKALQNKTYDDKFWKTETGMTLGQLWDLYKKS